MFSFTRTGETPLASVYRHAQQQLLYVYLKLVYVISYLLIALVLIQAHNLHLFHA